MIPPRFEDEFPEAAAIIQRGIGRRFFVPERNEPWPVVKDWLAWSMTITRVNNQPVHIHLTNRP